MNRRSLLALLGAAPLTGPAAVKAALAGGCAVGVQNGLTAGESGQFVSAGVDRAWQISSILRDRRETARYAASGSLNPHVAAKRSWSLAFKAHVQVQEEAEFRSMTDRLERLDNAGLLEICRIMGIEE